MLALTGLLVWACVAPLRMPDREKLLDLGRQQSLVLAEIRLTLDVQDVLLLTNSSRTAQVFGQLRVLPGEVFRLPFEQVGATSFACSSAFNGELLVRVVAPPDPGLARLRWRLDGLVDSMRHLPAVAPIRS